MFASPPSLEKQDGALIFEGYQSFVLSGYKAEPISSNLIQKSRVLSSMLQPKYFKHRSVLDIGGNAGYYSFKALEAGAESCTLIDVDNEVLQLTRTAKSQFSLDKLAVVTSDMSSITSRHDIVLALALVHWVYSCTETYGNLEEIIAKLASLSSYLCIVEWIAPEDPLIQEFGHNQWNSEIQSGPYSTEIFEANLSKYFERFEVIGAVSPTRILYAAYCSPNKIELDGPLPLLMGKSKLISSSKLCEIDGIGCWSRVYDNGSTVLKQCSGDLAVREATVIQKISKLYSSQNFVPNVISVAQHDTWSSYEMDKVEGPLASDAKALVGSPESFFNFAMSLLEALEAMQALGVKHHDLHSRNVIVNKRTSRAVLIDFSWASTPERGNSQPAELLWQAGSSETSTCDVYSAGNILKELNGGRFPQFTLLSNLMTCAPELRVRSCETLKRICLASRFEDSDVDCSVDNFEKELLHLASRLLSYTLMQNNTINLQKAELLEKQQLLSFDSAREHAAETARAQVKVLEQKLQELSHSKQLRLGSAIARWAGRAAPPDSAIRKALGRVYGFIFK